MNHPRYRQNQIRDLLRKVEVRLTKGESLASACKSLGVSPSSYRRWRVEYGENAKKNGTKENANAHPASTEDVVTKEGRASCNSKAPTLSEEAKALLDAANEASSSATNTWVVFLALLAYLVVTLGGVSHRDLLLNSPVKLPIIDVDIPLFSFFQYAPLLFLLIYLALLIQHVMLAGKFRNFTDAIEPYEKKSGKEHPARQLVDPYVVSQILAGPKRSRPIRWLMGLMTFVTFTLLPIITLLYFQVSFLPYHEVWITYWHRIAVLLGLVMLFTIMPIIHLNSRKQEFKVGPQSETWRASPLDIVAGGVFALLILGFSWLIATVPNEKLEEGLDRLVGFVPPIGGDKTEGLLNPLVRAAYERMSFDNKPEGEWVLRWLMSHRVIVVENADLVPDEGEEQDEVSLVLRERNLRFARLSRSNLRRADLTKADLRGALLREIRLEKARLPGAQLQGADLLLARLGGADLREAHLEGASLAYARLEGAYLGWARLQGGALPAHLQGVELGEAYLKGAVLWQTRLQGAALAGVQLQGADLRQAQLQGADLRQAHLRGADLREAQLQGADLEGADLRGVDLGGAGVWLVGPFANPHQLPILLGLKHLNTEALSADAKAELRQELQDNIVDDKLLESLEKRLNPILGNDPPDWEQAWLSGYNQSIDPAPADYAPILAKTACEDPDGYIAISMVDRAKRYSKTPDRQQYARPLAEALLAESCEAMKAPTDGARAMLKNLASVDLPQLGTDLDATSVSGLASGAYMAGQIELTHSSQIVGAGIVAGGPYACAESKGSTLFPFWPTAVLQNVSQAVNACMHVNYGAPDPMALIARAKELAEKGQIDPIGGLANDKVYLFSSDDDSLVVRDVVQAAEAFYKNAGLADANITFIDGPGGHAFLTDRTVPPYDAVGGPTPIMPSVVPGVPTFLDALAKSSILTEQGEQTCGATAPPFVTDCDYDQAKAILDWIYGSSERPLASPSAEAQGVFIVFDQRPYSQPDAGLADEGIVYVPDTCQEPAGCRVHIALHACAQSRETVGDAFIRGSRFAEMADTNRLVILFPQARASNINPGGCWDWWGYTGLDYLGKAAPQIAAIWTMVEHLAKSPEPHSIAAKPSP